MIDTHSHIYGEEFAEDISEVLARAKEAGVEKIFLPNINVQSIEPMLSLCRAYPGYLYPMMGLHPTDVAENYKHDLEIVERHLQEENHPYIAVGEVGLDFYWDRTFCEQQIEAFRFQVELAIRTHLPLMIHTRSAHEEMVGVLRDYKQQGIRGVFHCFGGTEQEAQELLEFEDFVLGIGGVLTYKKSTLPQALESVPLERIVLETDAPYLAPVPYRGKRNESAYVRETMQKLAYIYNVSAAEVEKVTNANVARVFSAVEGWNQRGF